VTKDSSLWGTETSCGSDDGHLAPFPWSEIATPCVAPWSEIVTACVAPWTLTEISCDDCLSSGDGNGLCCGSSCGEKASQSGTSCDCVYDGAFFCRRRLYCDACPSLPPVLPEQGGHSSHTIHAQEGREEVGKKSGGGEMERGRKERMTADSG
jgi:hypothetical protein